MIVPFLALAIFQQTASVSQNTRGTILFHQCQAVIRLDDSPSTFPDQDLATANHCLDFIQGFSEGLSAGGQACFNGAGHGTLVRVYVKFMETHPTYLDQDKGIGFYVAMLQAYPCAKK